MSTAPLITEWFFDPAYSDLAVKRLEKYFSRKRSANYLEAICYGLELQLERDPTKTCAVRFEAVIANCSARQKRYGRIYGEAVWQLLLVIYDRSNFDIKVWIGTEETIRSKSLNIRAQLNEQLRQPGVEAMICERGFDGSLAKDAAPL
jgi:hypothetical protein